MTISSADSEGSAIRCASGEGPFCAWITPLFRVILNCPRNQTPNECCVQKAQENGTFHFLIGQKGGKGGVVVFAESGAGGPLATGQINVQKKKNLPSIFIRNALTKIGPPKNMYEPLSNQTDGIFNAVPVYLSVLRCSPNSIKTTALPLRRFIDNERCVVCHFRETHVTKVVVHERSRNYTACCRINQMYTHIRYIQTFLVASGDRWQPQDVMCTKIHIHIHTY